MRTKQAPILSVLAVSFIFASGIFSVSLAIPPQSKGKKEPDKQERGIRIQPVKALPAKAKRFALVIGIDQYSDTQINRLDGAANDAKAISEALVNYSGFPPDQVILLSSNQPQPLQPTKNTILRKLSNLTEVGVPKDGLLLLFFAGHGIEKKGQAFLLPSDAELSGDVKLLEATAINVKTIYDWIQDSGIQQIILILDACRNNPEVGRGDEDQKLTRSYLKPFDFETRNREISAFATLYASELGQTAYEYKEKKHGYFTWALIEAIKGGAANEQGEVTLSNLRKYLQETVPKRVSLDLGAGKRQRPFAEIKGFKAEDLVFAWVKPTETKTASSVISIDPAAKDLVFWESIKDSNDPALYQAYLERFPNGEFVPIAKNRLANLPSQPPDSPQTQVKPTHPVSETLEPKKSEKNAKPSNSQVAKERKEKKSSQKSPPLEIPKTRTATEEIAKLPDEQILKDSATNPISPPQIASDGSKVKETIKAEVKPNLPKPDPEKLKQQSDKEEKNLWNSIAESTNPEDFNLYLIAFPQGKYATKATAKLAEVTELADWNSVKESQKKDDIKNFLAKYPKTSYAKQANARLNRIDEDAYWNSIKNNQGIDNFKTYLVLYPRGSYVDIARDRIKELNAATKSKSANSVIPEPRTVETNVNIPPTSDKQPEATAPANKSEPISLPKSEVKTYIEKSEKFIREQRWKEAIDMLNNAIKLQPETAEWHNRLGQALIEVKKWTEAESALRKAVTLEANQARWHNTIGRFLSLREQHLEAIDRCKKATELEPDNANFRADLSQVLLNQYGIQQEDLYHLKQNPGLRNRLKRIDESSILEAESEARKAIHLEPDNPNWHIQLGKVLIWLSKWSEAEQALQKAIQLNPLNPDWHNQLGLLYLAQEKPQEAQTAFREAVRLAPANSRFKANLKKTQQK